jgi:hypothetical protein
MFSEPLLSQRFRLTKVPGELAKNVQDVTFDFKNKTVTVLVQTTVYAADFFDSVNFTHWSDFELEVMDGFGKAIFGIVPTYLKLESHELKFAYSAPGSAMHKFVFSYTELANRFAIERPSAPEATVVPDKFMSPEEAVASVSFSIPVDEGDDDDYGHEPAGC